MFFQFDLLVLINSICTLNSMILFTTRLHCFRRSLQYDQPQTDADNFSTRNKRTGSKLKINSQNTEQRLNSLSEERISHRIFGFSFFPKWKHFKNDHWIVQCLVILLLFFVYFFSVYSLKQIIELIINFLGLLAYHLFIFISSSYFFLYFGFVDRNQIGFCFLFTHWTIVSHHIWMVCLLNWREEKKNDLKTNHR